MDSSVDVGIATIIVNIIIVIFNVFITWRLKRIEADYASRYDFFSRFVIDSLTQFIDFAHTIEKTTIKYCHDMNSIEEDENERRSLFQELSSFLYKENVRMDYDVLAVTSFYDLTLNRELYEFVEEYVEAVQEHASLLLDGDHNLNQILQQIKEKKTLFLIKTRDCIKLRKPALN